MKPKYETVTIRLFAGDKDRLAEMYREMGYNAAIRTIVRKHIEKAEELIQRRLRDLRSGSDKPERSVREGPIGLDAIGLGDDCGSSQGSEDGLQPEGGKAKEGTQG